MKKTLFEKLQEKDSSSCVCICICGRENRTMVPECPTHGFLCGLTHYDGDFYDLTKMSKKVMWQTVFNFNDGPTYVYGDIFESQELALEHSSGGLIGFVKHEVYILNKLEQK